MAVRPVDSTDSDVAVLFTWTGLLNTDTGEPVEAPAYGDRTIQVEGTFGAGGNAQIQGSNDGVNWRALNDPQGTVLDITAAKIEVLRDNPRCVRPNITAGDGTTAIAVTMYCRRAFR